MGLAALAAGVQMLVTASGAGLTIVMAAMAVLWLIATVHHGLLAKAGAAPQGVARQAMRHGPRLPRTTSP